VFSGFGGLGINIAIHVGQEDGKMKENIREALDQAAKFSGCYPEDFKGQTLEEVFRDCELGGAVVYWGLWNDAELQTII